MTVDIYLYIIIDCLLCQYEEQSLKVCTLYFSYAAYTISVACYALSIAFSLLDPGLFNYEGVLKVLNRASIAG